MMSKLANSSATAGARGSPGAVPPLTGASHAPLASHMAAQAAMSSKQIVEAAAAAGPTAVVSAMWDHASRAGVQWRGCNALKDMAYNGGACPPWWPYVPQSCLWRWGCVAVECCLMCDNAVARTESARVEICIAGGIAAVLSAMKGFPKDALVQHHACLSIMNLAFNSGA